MKVLRHIRVQGKKHYIDKLTNEFVLIDPDCFEEILQILKPYLKPVKKNYQSIGIREVRVSNDVVQQWIREHRANIIIKEKNKAPIFTQADF